MTRQVKERRTKEEALALAREIRGQIKRGETGRIHRVTKEENELLQLCRQLSDPKRALEEALEREKEFARVTVAACCDRYIQEYELRDSTMTRRDAVSKAKIIRNTLGERFLDSLTQHEIEQWRDTQLPGASRYKNNILSHLRHLFEGARVWGYVPNGHNPAKNVPVLRQTKSEPVVWAPEDLINSFRWYQESGTEESKNRIAFLALGAFAGMRPSEIDGVVENAMDFSGRTSILRNVTSTFDPRLREN